MNRIFKITANISMAIILFACNQNTDTPKVVVQSFQSKFPLAEAVSWEKESDSEWEVEFKMKEVEYSANFDSSGEWLETEYEVDKEHIPEGILKQIAGNYSSFKIESSEVISTSQYANAYEIKLESKDKDLELLFDDQGVLLSTQEKDED